jgi:hypothetical protein
LFAWAGSAAATPLTTRAATTAALSLTLAAIARGTRLSRGRRSWGVVGVERLRGSRKRVGAERDPFQDQLVSDLVEGRERRATRDDGSKMIVPLVQPSEDVVNEVAVGDHAAEVAEGVGHALHLMTVVAHREVALDEVAEHGVEMKRARLAIADELVLEREPDLARSDVALIEDVQKLTGNRAEDPGDDDALHALPGRVIDGRGIGENVVGEVVALQGEQNLIAPAGVACRRRVQNSRDKRANVLYPTGLCV